MEKKLNQFNAELIEEIRNLQSESETGGEMEEIFTKIMTTRLGEAYDIENVVCAYQAKTNHGNKSPHKINAYAISNDSETLDLIVSIFKQDSEVKKIEKREIDQSFRWLLNFYRMASKPDTLTFIDPSNPIYPLISQLSQSKNSDLRATLLRINLIIITNGLYSNLTNKGEVEGDLFLYKKVYDIDHFYSISNASSAPIKIDFREKQIDVPCLATPETTDVYQSYFAIIPGKGLSELYKEHGSKLLEQNVRAFLQFTAAVNKGIRNTIKNEPHMFLAYNNGIAATADCIELDETGKNIIKISNLQIVNGGQTTASLFHTSRKDKADLSHVYVPMKITLIKRPEDYTTIVANISKYSNTQNKVNNTDFSSNNKSLVRFEQIANHMRTPRSPQHPNSTVWFFERARGQYKSKMLIDALTPAKQKKFQELYPKSQVLTKDDLGVFMNIYREVFDDDKLVIGPHIVARGKSKNYVYFIDKNLPEDVNEAYVQDVIAIAILYNSCKKKHGVKPNSIGDLRSIVVPYTIALFGWLTDYRLNLNNIWRNQEISESLSQCLYQLMKKVNEYFIITAPGNNYLEWAKKEECWDKFKANSWNLDVSSIDSDLSDNSLGVISEPEQNADELAKRDDLETIMSLPSDLWKAIAVWGRDSKRLNENQQKHCDFVANTVKTHGQFTDEEREQAIEILYCASHELKELYSSLNETIVSTSNRDSQPSSVSLELPPSARTQSQWKALAMQALLGESGIAINKTLDALKGVERKDRNYVMDIPIKQFRADKKN